MNPRLLTIFDDLFPDSSPEFAAIADTWPEHVIVQMLTLVWNGFDRMKALPTFRQLDFSRNYAQLERSLTDLHMQEITVLYREEGSKFESFIPHHEAWEFQCLTERSARPPSNDLGFVLLSNRRIRWSVEAKVLKTATAIADYLGDLKKYLDGKSSPFSTQAALGAYLLGGDAKVTFASIGNSLDFDLTQHPAFPTRLHKLSQHQRSSKDLPGEVPSVFVCHHLVFALG